MIFRLLYLMVRMMSWIPLSAGQFTGRILGTAASLLPLDRFSTAMENIRKSFSGWGDREIKRLNRRVLVHFGQMLFEIPHILRLTSETLNQYVVFENEDAYSEAMKKGKGIFILTAHFGNWELMAAAIAIRFGPGAVVARPVDFEPLEQVLSQLRTRFGTEIIPKQRGMRKILGAIKAKQTIGILLDQNVDWYEGVFVDFLGRRACTNKGLALMALKTGTPVIPSFPIRQKDGRYRIVFEKAVDPVRSGDKTRDVEDSTAVFTKVIEKYVRRYPDHWFWFHRRWKTKPYWPLEDRREGSKE